MHVNVSDSLIPIHSQTHIVIVNINDNIDFISAIFESSVDIVYHSFIVIFQSLYMRPDLARLSPLNVTLIVASIKL